MSMRAILNMWFISMASSDYSLINFPAKGHEGTGVSLLWAKAERAGTVQRGSEKAQGDLINV